MWRLCCGARWQIHAPVHLPATRVAGGSVPRAPKQNDSSIDANSAFFLSFKTWGVKHAVLHDSPSSRNSKLLFSMVGNHAVRRVEVQILMKQKLHGPAIHSVMPVSGVIAKGVRRISEQGTASHIICRLPWLRSKLLQSHSPTVPPRRTTASCSNGCPKHENSSSMPFLEHAFHLF